MSPRVHDDDAGGSWIPLIFVGALGALIVVQAGFATLAIRSDPGVAAPNAYERGLAHNSVLREAASESALGWHVAVENQAEPAAADRHRGTLLVTASDAAKHPLDTLAVIGIVARPTRAGLDQRLAFRAVGEGRYVAAYDLPLPGLWQLDLLLEGGCVATQRSVRVAAP